MLNIRSKHGVSGESGFTLIEMVIAIGVVLALTVAGFIGYQGITDNARTAAVENAAAKVYSAAQAEEARGGNYAKVISDWNDSLAPEQIQVSSITGGGGEPLCVVVRSEEWNKSAARGDSATCGTGGGSEDGDGGNTELPGDGDGNGGGDGGETSDPGIDNNSGGNKEDYEGIFTSQTLTINVKMDCEAEFMGAQPISINGQEAIFPDGLDCEDYWGEPREGYYDISSTADISGIGAWSETLTLSYNPDWFSPAFTKEVAFTEITSDEIETNGRWTEYADLEIYLYADGFSLTERETAGAWDFWDQATQVVPLTLTAPCSLGSTGPWVPGDNKFDTESKTSTYETACAQGSTTYTSTYDITNRTHSPIDRYDLRTEIAFEIAYRGADGRLNGNSTPETTLTFGGVQSIEKYPEAGKDRLRILNYAPAFFEIDANGEITQV